MTRHCGSSWFGLKHVYSNCCCISGPTTSGSSILKSKHPCICLVLSEYSYFILIYIQDCYRDSQFDEFNPVWRERLLKKRCCQEVYVQPRATNCFLQIISPLPPLACGILPPLWMTPAAPPRGAPTALRGLVSPLHPIRHWVVVLIKPFFLCHPSASSSSWPLRCCP